jgi:hypothetical protein
MVQLMTRLKEAPYSPATERFNRRVNLLCRAGFSWLIFAITGTLFSSACVNIQLEIGNRPNIAALEKSLLAGVSTSADVRSILASPTEKAE